MGRSPGLLSKNTDLIEFAALSNTRPELLHSELRENVFSIQCLKYMQNYCALLYFLQIYAFDDDLQLEKAKLRMRGEVYETTFHLRMGRLGFNTAKYNHPLTNCAKNSLTRIL